MTERTQRQPRIVPSHYGRLRSGAYTDRRQQCSILKSFEPEKLPSS